MFGYRHWSYYGFWIAVAVVSVVMYALGGTSIANETNPGGGAAPVSFDQFIRVRLFVTWVFAFLGGPFLGPHDEHLTIFLGGAGMGLFLANLAYLWRSYRSWEPLNSWVAVAGVSLAASVVIYVGRFPQDLVDRNEATAGNIALAATPQRFALVATHFWVALVALMIMSYFRFRATEPGQRRAMQSSLIVGNSAMLILTLFLYVRVNTWFIQKVAMREDFPILQPDVVSDSELCFREYPLVFRNCLPHIDSAVDVRTYQLAIYGLAQFRDHPILTVLPPAYQDTDPVILDTPTPWMSAYLRRWYLYGVDEANIFHVTPQDTSIDVLRDPLTNRVTGYDDTTALLMSEFIEGEDTVWYLRSKETAANEASFTAIMETQDYLPTVIASGDPRYNQHLTLIRYEIAPEFTDDPIPVGDAIELLAWSAVGTTENVGLETLTCQRVTVQSWWAATDTLPENYALIASIENSAGEVISQARSNLTTVPTALWTPEQLYLDERVFFVDCELPPDEYRLFLRVESDASGPLPTLDGNSAILLRNWPQ
jgi:hypothetical protein